MRSWLRWKRSWDDLPENLPIDVYPCSNGEFIPERPTRRQRMIMQLAEEESERVRRKMGMSRRDFVRSAAAYSIGLWAIGQVAGGKWGNYAFAHNTRTNRACDLEWPGAQMANLPGEFIFDVQSHHVESDGTWRATNPGFEAFFSAIWAQAGGVAGAADPDPYWRTGDPRNGIMGVTTNDPDSGAYIALRGGREADPIEALSRYHYLKELFLDSSTNMTVLSAVPSDPMNQPLPIEKAALTCDMVADLGAPGASRTVMHAFVMPNRGSAGTTSSFLNQRPVFMDEEFDRMEAYFDGTLRDAAGHRIGDHIRGWKTYTAWGDIPYASGWYLDDDIGLAFLQHVRDLGDNYGAPKVVAVHKGFALPAFDQRAAAPRDVGPAARQYSDVNIVVYHSGYDTERQDAYPGDDAVNSADRSVNSFIKSLRENGWDASRFPDRNVPNVYAEIGSTWRSVMRNPDQASHLLGKLITHVGPKRVVWGTDSLWFGSPQSEIVALRGHNMTSATRALYNLPYGLEGDVENPQQQAPTPARTIRNAIFGRNAAVVYGVDPDAARNAISCDSVQQIRDAYLINQATPDPRGGAPLSMNQLHGPRTRRDLIRHINSKPWSP